MGYGAPLKNQNKGYDAQEKKDLMSDNPIAKDASGGRGSWMSKHVTRMGGSPLMAAKPDFLDLDGDKNTSEPMKEAAKGASPNKMHGALHMDKGAPTKMYGGKTGEESAKTKKEVKKVKANAKKDY